MAGPPGIAYVYLVYGMYDCLNVVTGPEGQPAAVLIRAVEPVSGMDLMREGRLAQTSRRRAARTDSGIATARARLAATPDDRLGSGPGLAAAAFAIDTGWNGVDLCDPASPLRLETGGDRPVEIEVSPRIGVAYAGEDWASRPWRFTIAGNRSVSGRAAAR